MSKKMIQIWGHKVLNQDMIKRLGWDSIQENNVWKKNIFEKSKDWLQRWIKEPDAMIVERDPIAIDLLARYNNILMPNLRLSDDDANQVIDFIDKESASLIKK